MRQPSRRSLWLPFDCSNKRARWRHRSDSASSLTIRLSIYLAARLSGQSVVCGLCECGRESFAHTRRRPYNVNVFLLNFSIETRGARERRKRKHTRNVTWAGIGRTRSPAPENLFAVNGERAKWLNKYSRRKRRGKIFQVWLFVEFENETENLLITVDWGGWSGCAMRF